jgi:hypothetical protein
MIAGVEVPSSDAYMTSANLAPVTSHFYRFRPAHHLLAGYRELERQEIFFASPEKLNDPLDGFKDVFWLGDSVLWTNLFKHYLLCLMHTMVVALISGSESVFPADQTFVFLTEDILKTPQLREIYREICNFFFKGDDYGALPNLLSQRQQVRRNELECYLRLIHFRAVYAIYSIFELRGHVPPLPQDDPLRKGGESSPPQLFAPWLQHNTAIESDNSALSWRHILFRCGFRDLFVHQVRQRIVTSAADAPPANCCREALTALKAPRFVGSGIAEMSAWTGLHAREDAREPRMSSLGSKSQMRP